MNLEDINKIIKRIKDVSIIELDRRAGLIRVNENDMMSSMSGSSLQQAIYALGERREDQSWENISWAFRTINKWDYSVGESPEYSSSAIIKTIIKNADDGPMIMIFCEDSYLFLESINVHTDNKGYVNVEINRFNNPPITLYNVDDTIINSLAVQQFPVITINLEAAINTRLPFINVDVFDLIPDITH